MGLVSARLDDKDEEFLRGKGINLSKLLREAARDEAERLRRLEALDFLDKVRAKARPSKVTSEELVRRMRDGEE